MTATEFELLGELEEESSLYQSESLNWRDESELGLLPRTAVARSSQSSIDTSRWRVDPLRGHAGSGANLFLRWNNVPIDARTVDVVVHLHGYISAVPNADTLIELARRSGLDLSGRTRPTLAILPRGRRITPAEVREHQERLNKQPRKPGMAPKRARNDVYTFPALTRDDGKGLESLVSGALVWFGGQVGRRDGQPFQLGRLILTAHSGGGAALNMLVAAHTRRRVCNPDEVHVFDGLYGEATGLKSWVSARLATDGRRSSGDEMRAQDGSLRVFYNGTRYWSEDLAKSLPSRAHQLWPWYRVECTTVTHLEIPNKYGPPLLRDRAADLSFGNVCVSGGATRPPARSAASKRQRLHAGSPSNGEIAPARADLPSDVRGWILSTDRSAIELIANLAMRSKFLREINWNQEYFRGNPDATGRPAEGRLAEELFSAMARVIPERRVPFSLRYRPDIADIVVPVPGEPGKKLHPEAAAAFARMRKAAAKDGIPIRLLPGLRTAWRSAADQAQIHKGQPNPFAAAARIGPHMYGLAVDLALGVLGPRFREANTRTPDRMANVVRMYRSPVYKWMALYGNRFGWFPYRREPWHWEYNPQGFKERFEANRGKSREVEFESELEPRFRTVLYDRESLRYLDGWTRARGPSAVYLIDRPTYDTIRADGARRGREFDRYLAQMVAAGGRRDLMPPLFVLDKTLATVPLDRASRGDWDDLMISQLINAGHRLRIQSETDQWVAIKRLFAKAQADAREAAQRQRAAREFAAYFVLDAINATLSMIEAANVTMQNGHAVIPLGNVRGTDRFVVPGGDAAARVIGDIHTHYLLDPLIDLNRSSVGTTIRSSQTSLHSGVSPVDVASARNRLVVYAVDSNYLHRAIPDGTKNDKLPRSGDVLREALRVFGGEPGPRDR